MKDISKDSTRFAKQAINVVHTLSLQYSRPVFLNRRAAARYRALA